MIRINLLFFLLISYFGQQAEAQLRIGPTLGTHVSRSKFADSDYRATHKSYLVPGLHGGVALNYQVNKLYSLHTELLYSQLGRRVERIDPNRSLVSNKSLYHYINLPIMLRLSGHKSIRNNHLEYYANIGPSFNYWLGGSGKISSDEIEENISMEGMFYNIVFAEAQPPYGNSMYVANPHRMQMSLDIGGGVIFDLGFSNHVSVDLRTSLGIGKTYMGEKEGGSYGLVGYAENLESVNHVYAVSVGYLRDFDLLAMFVKGKTKKKR